MNKKEKIKAKLKGHTCIECQHCVINNLNRLLRKSSIYCKRHRHGKHKKDWCKYFLKGGTNVV